MFGDDSWGIAFWYPTDDGRSGDSLVPLDVQTTRAQREAMGFDEDGYQLMLELCGRVNPGCGQPLLVLEESGEIVDGSEDGVALGTVSYTEVCRAGVDVGSRMTRLPVVEYRDHCERRDCEMLASGGVELPLSRDTSLAQAVTWLRREAQAKILHDLSLSEDMRSAALRQLDRETFELADASGYSSLSLGELLDDARGFEERGKWSALEITPDFVAQTLEGLPDYAGLSSGEVAEIADNACDNLVGDTTLADVARDQVLAEARTLVEHKASHEARMRPIDSILDNISPERALSALSEAMRLEGRPAEAAQAVQDGAYDSLEFTPSEFAKALNLGSDSLTKALQVVSADEAVAVAVEREGFGMPPFEAAYLTESVVLTGDDAELSPVLVDAGDSPTYYGWSEGAWSDLAEVLHTAVSRDHYAALVSSDGTAITYVDLSEGGYVTSDGERFDHLSEAWGHCLSRTADSSREATRNASLSKSRRAPAPSAGRALNQEPRGEER